MRYLIEKKINKLNQLIRKRGERYLRESRCLVILNGIEELMAYDFGFEIKNFGPIDHGKIKTRPLTFLIGPNGSGKSYIAMLLQSIFDSHTRSDQNVSILLNSILDDITKEDFTSIYLDKFPDITRQIEEFKKKEEIPIESIEPLIDNILKSLYENRLDQELSYSFSSPLEDLIQIGKNSFQIKIDMGSYSACMTFNKGEKLILREHTPLNTNLKDYQKKYIIDRLKSLDFGTSSIMPEKVRSMMEFIFSTIMIFSVLTAEVMATSCHYLPAARSGIILVRKRILTDEYKKNPFFDRKFIQEQQLSGAVSSFIYNIHNLPEKQGQFYNLARELESEMIGGEILKSLPEGHIYPDIKYKYLGKEIPLHMASSTVSELAPIILYLKYIVKQGDILVIEEPEAHLHPKNQLILAKYLVRLIRNGVRIVITTHSDYMLQKLNNFIMLSKVESRRSEDYLLPDEVGAYGFEKGGPNSYKLNELEVTKEDGISDRDFSKVVESLYEETIALKEDLYSRGI